MSWTDKTPAARRSGGRHVVGGMEDRHPAGQPLDRRPRTGSTRRDGAPAPGRAARAGRRTAAARPSSDFQPRMVNAVAITSTSSCAARPSTRWRTNRPIPVCCPSRGVASNPTRSRATPVGDVGTRRCAGPGSPPEFSWPRRRAGCAPGRSRPSAPRRPRRRSRAPGASTDAAKRARSTSSWATLAV